MAAIVITTPSSAEEGERVSASVKVTSILPYHASYKGDIKALPALYPDYVIGEIDQIILSGDSVTVDVSFTMPDCNTTVFLRLERWMFDHWGYDSSKSKVVSLEKEAVPEGFPVWAKGVAMFLPWSPLFGPPLPKGLFPPWPMWMSRWTEIPGYPKVPS